MLKKAMCLAACLVMLLLPSCKGDRGNNGRESGVPCPIEGLEWGMSTEECLEALSLTEADVEIDRSSGEDVAYVIMDIPLSGYEAYGYPVKGTRLFILEKAYGLSIGLANLSITFDPAPSFQELAATVEKDVQPYLVEDPENPLYDSYSITYNTPRSLAEADPDLAEKYFPINDWYGVPSDADVGGLPGREDYPYGSITVQKADKDTGALFVNNWVAVTLKKAAEAEAG